MPGGVCISEDVYRQVRGKLNATFEDIGEQKLKNIVQPVRAYRVSDNRADLTQLGAWLVDGQLRAIIDSRFALGDYGAAFHKLESKHTHGKIVIDVMSGLGHKQKSSE